MLKQLERKLGRFAIPHLTWILLIGQVFFYLMALGNPELIDKMELVADRVREGQWIRLITFLIIPPMQHPVFFFFTMYFFYIMGTALENQWGEFRYNLYIFIGYLSTVLIAFVFPTIAATNIFIMTSIFLAFAYLFPDFEILLFFIIPVKVKYLGILIGLILIGLFLMGAMVLKAYISISLLNFVLFFSADISRRTMGRNRRIAHKIAAIKEAQAPFHTCSVCKRTDKSDPQLHFRYLPGNGDPVCFCEDHLPQ